MLNLRRGPGAYALLSRADGQLTRAGQHYYSHLGLRPPSKDFDYNQPLIREGPNDYILLRNGQKKLVRSLQGGEHRLTKLGKGFFRDKYYEYLVHVPVIIRGRRRSGRNAGAGYERRDWLPVNELGGATRHPAHLTEEQVAQRVRQQVEASLDPGGPILQLSDETYFLDPEGHWVVSTQSTHYRNSRTEVETLLRQRMRGLRSVSFQLPCEEDVLPSAFEDKPLCVPRQLAELLQLSVEEVRADFDAMLRHQHEGVGLAAEGLHVGQVHLQLVHGLQRHEAVVASLRPVLVHPEAVQKRLHLPSGDAGVAHLGLLQRLRYAAETGAGILVDGLDGSPAGVGHVSYGFFGPRWACQASTSSSRAWKPLHTPQSTLVRCE